MNTPLHVECVIDTDADKVMYGARLEQQGRLVFRFPDCSPAGNGAAVTVQIPGELFTGRFVTPATPAEEGPSIQLAAGATVFVPQQQPSQAGMPLGAKWRGCSDFRLLQRFIAVEDIDGILRERSDCGADILRVFAMKTNNTGWELNPANRPNYQDDVRRFLDSVRGRTRVYLTVFADTKFVMPTQATQKTFWDAIVTTVRPFASFVAVEFCNEFNHPTQQIEPAAFSKPAGIVSSHGSGLTDANPFEPYWDVAGYSARRDHPPDGRGFTNYDPYEFQAEFPMRVPKFAQEGMKPFEYGNDPKVAELMGRHASIGVGGFFHCDSGIDSRAFSADERACAEAFFRGLR